MNRKDLEVLYQVTKSINSILDYSMLLEKVMDLAIETVGAERGAIVLTGSSQSLELAVARHISKKNLQALTNLSSSVVRKVLENKKPLLLHDVGDDVDIKQARSVLVHNIQSVLCVPLSSQRKLIGAIYVDSRSSKGVFTRDNLQFLSAFSDQAAIAIENARLHKLVSDENRYLRKELEHDYQFDNIVGKSPQMREVFDLMRKLLDSTVPVFIGGETGTGKELVARALHYNSHRKNGRFVPVNCGSLPESLLESELFGYKKGAFTGAMADKKGLFEQAHLGTLFLDEIADISVTTQAKLLRALQEQEFFRIGDTEPRSVDVRVVTATNKDLTEEIKEKRFREDLFYRLNVVRINLPPLRDRRGDIPLLAEFFLQKYCKKEKREIGGLTSDSLMELESYQWPGNVRELENVISRAVVLSAGENIMIDDLEIPSNQQVQKCNKTLKGALRDFEASYVKKVLAECKGNRKLTAQRLGISLRSLQYKIKDLSGEKEV